MYRCDILRLTKQYRKLSMKPSKHIYFLALIIFCLGCFAGTNDANDPNILDSDNFPIQAERIQKLGQQIKSFSKIKDAEFDLFNSGGFSDSRASTAPGPTDWNYEFAVKIEPADLPKWRNGFRSFTSDSYDNSWIKKITAARSENWTTNSTPKYYKRVDSNVTMIIYENEGFIFKQVIAQ
ncbi:MAG: hypothetical protein ACI94Y_002777 [Maribacter sp.]|jgi:hypothetical protein